MDFTQILGWIATFLFSIMIIPQMIRTVKSKDTSGVSLLMFVIFLIANIIALIYALLNQQLPLIIKYIIALTTTIIYLVLYGVYYQRKKKKGMVNNEKINIENGIPQSLKSDSN